MYKEMRSSKTMKRKWRDSNTARTAKPKPADDEEDLEESSEEDFGHGGAFGDSDREYENLEELARE